MRDLGTLGGGRSEAVAINVRGAIVGVSTTVGGQTHAFSWTDGKMRDLGTFGVPTSAAIAISDLGHVVGRATAKTGQTHAVLWTLHAG